MHLSISHTLVSHCTTSLTYFHYKIVHNFHHSDTHRFNSQKESVFQTLLDSDWNELIEETNDENPGLNLIDSSSCETERVEEDIEEESTGNEKIAEDISNQQIYHGHHMTVHASMVMILMFTLCHNVSGTQLADLLTLISAHCLYPHPGIRSLYMFKQYFASMKSPLKKHFYCAKCHASIEEHTQECQVCHCDLTAAKAKQYFIEIPVETQLKNLLEKKDIPDMLQHRFKRQKKNENGIEDIYDGSIYKKLSTKEGPLSKSFPFNVTFTWNTDGVPVFKSSRFSIWPMYLIVNELPYKIRMKKENMILTGLWFGEEKPIMNMFTRPLITSLRNLEEGIEVTVKNQKHISKAFLVCGTADLPAKSLVLNCNQFNGKYSCMRCMHPGETYKTDKGGSVRIFPHDVSKPAFRERQDEQCLEDAIKATANRSVINGIKGPSFLMPSKHYSYVFSSGIDYMHGVLLGITKLLITLWISPSYSKEKFSVSGAVDLIDERLIKIKPPNFITRIPRTLSNHFKYWKASELRSWLCFYSLPIMFDILSKDYILHHACLVEAIVLLCSDSILEADIVRSQTLLSYFVYMFPRLYGERYLTLNMHSLLHLPGCVKDLGPLWVYSCFPFEDVNGDLLNLFHGTQNIELQILSGVNVLQNFSKMTETILSADALDFILKLQNKQVRKKLTPGTSTGRHPLGKGIVSNVCDEVYVMIMREFKCKPSKVLRYQRVMLRGRVSMQETHILLNILTCRLVH
ncbi:uncharacterized protein LOC128554033 [Mercenaria mercenaria]|uniref:uncharacterized protein LOC128554033 n=1 Tax=Mercenaria mercenaria TaxID=6596 RepID=UPI00234F2D3B|nr:uncharacterized protein LOC128554033 [Mercenaria mercenaria]